MIVRTAGSADDHAVWAILAPVIRAGETYTLPRDWSKEQALTFWSSPGHTVFVAEEDGQILGTYFLKANRLGGGSHVANCGYVTAVWGARRGASHVRALFGVRPKRRLSRHAVQLCLEQQRTRRTFVAEFWV
jgi:ribosomal protein S18 acetylase RimI-like enzyme